MERIKYVDLIDKKEKFLYDSILGLLLKARRAARIPTNKGFADEDVNVYIAGILNSHVDMHYLETVRRYWGTCDHEVFLRAKGYRDNYTTYCVYKANADHLLVHTGLFSYHALSEKELQKRLFRMSIYYAVAGRYHIRMYRKPTAISQAMEKLSCWPLRYIIVLSELRHNYFKIVRTLGREQFAELVHDIARYGEKELPYKDLVDEFLDTLLLRQRTKEKELLDEKLCALSVHIKELHPTFPSVS